MYVCKHMYMYIVHPGPSKVSVLNGHTSRSDYKTGSTVATITSICFYKKMIKFVNGYMFRLNENE